MTEAEWNACTDPTPMLEHLGRKVSDRKLRLFAVGCCGRVWKYLSTDRDKTAVEIAERYAEGTPPSDSEVQELLDKGVNDIAPCADHAAAYACFPFTQSDVASQVIRSAHYSARGMSEALVKECDTPTPTQEEQELAEIAEEKMAQTGILRCICGPLPFRPVTLEPAWLTSTATNLAQSIYTERAFDRMPILADALEDAGCTDAGILEHCRSGGEHCRG
jgi:hypothetical protein